MVTQFGDHETAERLLAGFITDDEQLATVLKDVHFMIKLLRGKAPVEEQLQFLMNRSDLGPSEDWVAAMVIQREESADVLLNLIDILNALKERAPEGCADAINHRISYAREKLEGRV